MVKCIASTSRVCGGVRAHLTAADEMGGNDVRSIAETLSSTGVAAIATGYGMEAATVDKILWG